MRSSACCPTSWPEAETLRALLADVQRACPGFPDVLVAEPVTAGPPAELGACATLPADGPWLAALKSDWVLSTSRVAGHEYTYVAGRADCVRAGMWRTRSVQDWPRLLHTPRRQKRLIYLHAWIAACVWGLPPSERHEASHICGNARCLHSTHIRWQVPLDNTSDRHHHAPQRILEANPETTPARTSKRAWPGASGRVASALEIRRVPRTRSVCRPDAPGASWGDARESGPRVLFD